ncbi:aa3-type cytochrome c oxidase subunit IV [Methylocapsa polymorpha]|uniref:Aa3-type cytochrome c oxidase subunit IV n=1 Tax=Methylocapsa polymorpha TaxID=3080828 RepID=A0ABZ0HXI9_9HYPH|nr:aa3-type cytochrome c oxidase subunit IV [Methylocapsa sp. RX1]
MAEDHAHPAGQTDADFAEHEKTYHLFLQLVKYTVIGVAALLALLAFFLG